jgi:tripartite-type tricarboxylate transporter receptor subunit TctC
MSAPRTPGIPSTRKQTARKIALPKRLGFGGQTGRAWAAALMVALACNGALAQDWPARPIRLIVPFPPGGPTDLIGRTAAQILSDDLHAPVVVENRPGGSGVTGMEALAHAAPDGYTLGLTSITLATAPHLGPVGFDALHDFSPIGRIASTTPIIDAHPSFPADDLAGLVAYARAHPGLLQFGTPGVATVPHLAAEMLQAAAGIRMVHVPYKGTAQLTNDLLAGVISLNFESSLVLAYPNIRAGKLKPIAILDAHRSALLPQVPTVAESGYPAIQAAPWFGLGGPAGLPEDRIRRLNAALVHGLESPAVLNRFAAVGVSVQPSTPEAFGAFIRTEYERWGTVIRSLGIRAP